MSNLSLSVDRKGGVDVLELQGDLDETTDFGRLLETLGSAVRVDLSGVRRINSCGVREWINFVRALSSKRTVSLAGCSPPVVEQLNMVFNFRGSASVESFYAPFVCTSCEAASFLLLTPPEVAGGAVAERKCSSCGGRVVFDEMPERYLAFLQEQ